MKGSCAPMARGSGVRGRGARARGERREARGARMDEIKHCRLIEKLPEVSGFSLIIFLGVSFVV